MSYCTIQNMIDRFTELELIQLSDRDNLGIIDNAIVTQSINDADAEINSYLTRYTLPLSNVPANMVRMACDIARYYLYDDAMIDAVRVRYDQAIAYLQLVAKGVIQLSPDVNGTSSEISNGGILLTSNSPVFGIDDY